jgi:hypothetical protein
MSPLSNAQAAAAAKYTAKKKAQDPVAWREMEKLKKRKQRQKKKEQKKPLSVQDILAMGLKHEGAESKRVATLNQLVIAAQAKTSDKAVKAAAKAVKAAAKLVAKAVKAQAEQSKLGQNTRDLAMTEAFILASVQNSVDGLHDEDDNEDDNEHEDDSEEDIPADPPVNNIAQAFYDSSELP